MGWFDCKTCASHTEHIASLRATHAEHAASLRAEIEGLKKLVYAPIFTPTVEQRESDLLLSGTQERTPPSPKEQLEQDAIQAASIFSATHDEVGW